LLQGLLLCGICGQRLSVRYTGNCGIYPVNDCTSRKRDALAAHHCLSLPAKPLDDAIVQRLLVAGTPVTVRLALEALSNLEEHDKAISAQWCRRIERARYDADLAERRYDEADPSNRLVAGTLEKRWNDAMQRGQLSASSNARPHAGTEATDLTAREGLSSTLEGSDHFNLRPQAHATFADPRHNRRQGDRPEAVALASSLARRCD
jgi:hypothetical protein